MGTLRPSVCIDAVLGDVSTSDAVAEVHRAGIKAFEFWGWWDKDLETLINAKEAHGMSVSACCTQFISLVDATKRDAYLEGLAGTIEATKRIGTSTIISQVGDALTTIGRDEQRQSLIDGLKEAAPMLEAAGRTLVIEPLNELVDHAGYYLIRSDEAFDIVRQVGSSAVKVVFDIYHQQISEGNLISNIVPNIDLIGHFHAAGNPGRNELSRGEIHYPDVFGAIRETAYDGFVGLEYWPKTDPIAELRTISEWLDD
ncbi:MAG: TIM barrel protein [Planctomycetota bacterium]